MNLIERIIPEEEELNEESLPKVLAYMDQAMNEFFLKVKDLNKEQLAEDRYQRFRRM